MSLFPHSEPGVQRLQPFGETIFATMSAAAVRFNAINLGQGFPDQSGPPEMIRRACEAMTRGDNQYAPARGVPSLRAAIAEERNTRYGMSLAADDVLVTVGATEAIAASLLGLVEPGEEVIVFEPYYDSYAAAIAMAGAARVTVPLAFDAARRTWDLDATALADAITENTAAIIVNSPHNPSGSVFSPEAMRELARLACEHDLIVISDEVYEHLIFDGVHRPVAALPGMAERTVSISSAAKTLCVTGWKTGWAIAAPPLLDAIARAKQYLTYVGVTPVQDAVAYALGYEQDWISAMVKDLEQRKNEFSSLLRQAGCDVYESAGTYFVLADVAPLGVEDAAEWCLRLPEKVGVAAVPVSVLCDNPERYRSLVRFAFSKRPELLQEAGRRLVDAFG